MSNETRCPQQPSILERQYPSVTPERLILHTTAQLIAEGITPQNVDTEQALGAAERLLKVLGGHTELPPRQLESAMNSPTRAFPVYQQGASRPRYDWSR